MTIFVVTGQSLSGKTTLVKQLVEETGIKQIITYTNRPIRDGEIDGVDYHFVSTENIETNDSYFGKRYFYTKYRKEPFIYAMNIEDMFVASMYHDCIIISDPKGLREIKKRFPKNNVVSIYINITMEDMIERSKKRGDSLLEVERRWNVDYHDFSSAKYYADIVLDSSQDDMVEYMKKVIKGELII